MAQKQTLRIRECGGMECGAVENDLPVVPRVKILGWESQNRRRYLPESVQAEVYQDKVINLNHPIREGESRRVQERFGWFDNVTREADGVYGDLHYNPEVEYAKAFAWWAKNKPDKVGMSHDAVGQGHTENGIFIVEKVIRVKSVDLVADPATTTKGLFEAMDPELNDGGEGGDDLKTLEDHIKNAVTAICDDDSLDLKAKLKKIKAALKLLEDPEEKEGEVEEGEEGEEGEKNTKESVKPKKDSADVKSLREELDTLKTKLALKERQELSAKLIVEAKLPAVAVTETFLEQMSEAKDETAMKKLVEDRKQLASIQKPRSSGPVAKGVKEGQLSNKDFAAKVKGR